MYLPARSKIRSHRPLHLFLKNSLAFRNGDARLSQRVACPHKHRDKHRPCEGESSQVQRLIRWPNQRETSEALVNNLPDARFYKFVALQQDPPIFEAWNRT